MGGTKEPVKVEADWKPAVASDPPALTIIRPTPDYIPTFPATADTLSVQVAQSGPKPTVALEKASKGTASAWPLMALSPLHVESSQRSTPPGAGKRRGSLAPMGGQKGARVRPESQAGGGAK